MGFLHVKPAVAVQQILKTIHALTLCNKKITSYIKRSSDQLFIILHSWTTTPIHGFLLRGRHLVRTSFSLFGFDENPGKAERLSQQCTFSVGDAFASLQPFSWLVYKYFKTFDILMGVLVCHWNKCLSHEDFFLFFKKTLLFREKQTLERTNTNCCIIFTPTSTCSCSLTFFLRKTFSQ